ncbi:MAG: hypothetical protein KAW67_10320 [Candidatus Eisenbacteria sp.]|nr:hypothetical protein [Candidatus Eisenbacteria bacterium]
MRMRPRLVTVVVLVSLLTGCATVREVDLDSSGSGLDEINAAAKRKQISVELISGGTRSGLKLDVGPDTTCWTEGDTSWLRQGDEDRVCVPTSDVRKITVHKRLNGCLLGGGIGLGAGLAATAAACFAIAMDPSVDGSDMGLAAIYLGIIGGGVGSVVGAVVGVSRGEDVYILNP